MYRLAKLGFTQSYTYFAWRNTKAELTAVLHRADADGGARVLPAEPLAEHAGHPDRVPAVRRAAGVHGPARAGRDAGRQLRHLRPGVRAVREHGRASRAARSTWTRRSTRSGTGTSTGQTACATSSRGSTASGARTRRCRATASLRFHPVDNEQLIAYSKSDRRPVERRAESSSTSTRTTRRPAGWTLPLDELGLDAAPVVPGPRPADRRPLPVAGRRATTWSSIPQVVPAHIFRVRRRVRTEQDFEYFM